MMKAERVTKCFGQKKALDEVSLSLEEGRIFGLVGTNGAGKSTMLRVLSGIYRADNGTATLDNCPVFENEQAKQQICYVSDEPTFLTGATIQEMGKFQKAFYPSQDDVALKSLCDRFSLSMNERINSFSKGTQKRVQIVLALSRHPRVLLCDETFDGLDPVMRESMKRVLGETMVDEGLTTVLAGHSLQEMEDICDSVGFLHEGKLLTSGDMEHVLSRYAKIQVALDQEWQPDMLNGLDVLGAKYQGRLAVITIKGEQEEAMSHFEKLSPIYIEAIPLSLEEVFIIEMEEQGYAK